MLKELKLNSLPSLVSLFCLFLASSYGYDYTILALFVFFLGYFLLKLTTEVSITYLMSILAIFQWLVGSVVYYSDLNPGMTFQISIMQVKYETYFQYAFPGTIAFVLGLNLFKIRESFLSDLKIKISQNIAQFVNKAKIMIIVGFTFEIFLSLVPIFLRSYVGYIVYLKYVGLGILLLNYIQHRDKKALFYLLVAIPVILLGVLKSLMFGEFVFITALIILVLAPFLRISLLKRLLFTITLGSLVIIIQLVKGPSRAYKEKHKEATAFELIENIRNSNLISVTSLRSEWFLAYSISRFNQGSIVSWVMSRVPKKLPFENGSTVVAAAVGSFVPRIVWPSKPEVGAAMYMKYTGLEVKGTSFGISQLGEAYVNFGVKGGIAFMFFLGLLFNLFLNLSLKKSQSHLVFYWLIPVIFLHGIKVETDLTRTVGYIIRFMIVMGIFNWLLKKFFSKSIY